MAGSSWSKLYHLPKKSDEVSDILNYFEENGFWLIEEKDAGEYRFDGQNKYHPLTQNEKLQDFQLPFSRGIKCSSDLVFLRKPEHIDHQHLKHYVHLLCKIQQFDLAYKIIKNNPTVFDQQLLDFLRKKSNQVRRKQKIKFAPLAFYIT